MSDTAPPAQPPQALTDALNRFVEVAWRSSDSIFTPGKPVWTAQNLDELHRRFVQNPDETEAPFLDKLKGQLSGAPPETIQLTAELLYVHLLLPKGMGAKAKSKLLDEVRSWVSPPVAFPEELRLAFETGLVNNQAMMMNRPFQMWYIIEALRKWHTLPESERARLLQDAWAFKRMTEDINIEKSQAMREVLLFIVHPERFECTSSVKHKEMIAAAFRERVNAPAVDLDELLAQIRSALTPEFGERFSFYDEKIRTLWDRAPDTAFDRFMDWARRIRRTEAMIADDLGAKRAFGESLRTARTKILRDEPDGIQVLMQAFSSTKKLMPWHIQDRFVSWCYGQPDNARAALKVLWAQGDLIHRIDRCLDALPRQTGRGDGVRAVLISILLMAEDPEQYPICRVRQIRAASKLAGAPLQWSKVRATARYTAALQLLDRMVETTEVERDPIANRLEAESVVWAMMKHKKLPPGWSESDWRDLVNYRKSGQGTGEVDTDNEDEDDPPDNRLDELADTLMFEEDFLREVVDLIEDKRQVIFYGPPGTGKTYVALQLAKLLAESPQRVRLVQFHPAYTYEDFVEGYRPAPIGGNPGFKLAEGPIRAMAREASASPDERFVLVIDELNRGNPAKVFGELYFLLEYREHAVRLQYSESDFILPKNLLIIGTMNSADRTIALMDAALRRRFYFVGFYPDREPVQGLLRRWLDQHQPSMRWVADAVDQVNRELSDRHLAIGPSHFMKRGLTDDQVRMIWRHAILPYIEDQFFGDPDRLAEFELDRVRQRLSPRDPD